MSETVEGLSAVMGMPPKSDAPAIRRNKPREGVRPKLSRGRALLYGLLTVGQIASLIHRSERPALAYVDPGSGLLALQMLGATVAGGLFFLRRKLYQLFRRTSDKAPNESQPAFGGSEHGDHIPKKAPGERPTP